MLRTEDGWVFNQRTFLNDCYKTVVCNKGNLKQYQVCDELFNINAQFLRPEQVQNELNERKAKRKLKRKMKSYDYENLNLSSTIDVVKTKLSSIIKVAKCLGLFETLPSCNDRNESAKRFSESFYLNTSKIQLNDIKGGNNSSDYILAQIRNEEFIIPPKCLFYCYDVRDIRKRLALENQFNLILLDPPWWNKYIRRKKAKSSGASYEMLFNKELADLPIAELLAPHGLVVVWCTNAKSHLQAIEDTLFPQWGVRLLAKWYWVKVTASGEPVCNFATSTEKQPFEQIWIGRSTNFNESEISEITVPNNKILVSIPSALHSHKPQLSELLQPYLPPLPNCLELFARSLQSSWTSYGLEAIRLQHSSLYQEILPPR